MYLTDYSGTISSPLQLNVEIHIVDIITDIDEKYKVTFNGYIYIKIDKRQSLENVKELRIYRDLNLKSANIIHAMKEEDNSKKTLNIRIVITIVLLLITGMGIFYILRRYCINSSSKSTSKNVRDLTIDSLKSHTSNKTDDHSNITYF
ncbi:unnamed protein product [Rotaria sordida]|uniref:Uncharacterized protein n=1 Tax=Rotaria sordida TaxID=392033 RepID=A0A818Z9K5_9BILA|nr:unnamed protein product [Rotaria sordida]CAF3765434.1 unnamed protein product [Rotaria sordida]